MNTEEGHRKQIKDLVKAYGKPLVAAMLNVSVRTMTNYLSETEPTMPHDGTLRKLKEIYGKHEKGVRLDEEEKGGMVPSKNGNQDETVVLMKEIIGLLKAENAELKERNQKLAMHVNESFTEVKKLAVINRSFLKTILLVLGRIVAHQEKKTAEKIHSEIGTLLGEVQTGAS